MNESHRMPRSVAHCLHKQLERRTGHTKDSKHNFIIAAVVISMSCGNAELYSRLNVSIQTWTNVLYMILS